MCILQDICVLWYTSNASSYGVARNLDTHDSFTCLFRKKHEFGETQGAVRCSRMSQFRKLGGLQYKVCLTIIETQTEKSLSSPSVASEVDTENLRSAISQGSGHVIILFAPSWPLNKKSKRLGIVILFLSRGIRPMKLILHILILW